MTTNLTERGHHGFGLVEMCQKRHFLAKKITARGKYVSEKKWTASLVVSTAKWGLSPPKMPAATRSCISLRYLVFLLALLFESAELST